MGTSVHFASFILKWIATFEAWPDHSKFACSGPVQPPSHLTVQSSIESASYSHVSECATETSESGPLPYCSLAFSAQNVENTNCSWCWKRQLQYVQPGATCINYLISKKDLSSVAFVSCCRKSVLCFKELLQWTSDSLSSGLHWVFCDATVE